MRIFLAGYKKIFLSYIIGINNRLVSLSKPFPIEFDFFEQLLSAPKPMLFTENAGIKAAMLGYQAGGHI
jgi:hypothetical protein